jgi:hypothetical protein
MDSVYTLLTGGLAVAMVVTAAALLAMRPYLYILVEEL